MKLQPLTAVLVKLLGAISVFKGLLASLGLWHYSYMFSSNAHVSYLEPTAKRVFMQMVLTTGIQIAAGILAYWKSSCIAGLLCRGVDENSQL
jgi:hypothetical protein